MKNKSSFFFATFVLLLCVFLSLLTVQNLHDRGVYYPSGLSSDFANLTYYEFNSTTIIANVRNGEIDVFSKLEIDPNTSDISNTEQQDFFFWSQNDYFQVADALHKFVWDEDVGDWKINSMDFFRFCGDNPTGFSSGQIIFYRQSSKSNSYETHLISIYSNGNSNHAVSGDINLRRPLLGWTSLKPSKFRINADDALRIAEENGGREFRAKYNNECRIKLVLRPNPSNDNDWLVYYDYQGSLITFEIRIDPYIGWH